ncbi:hypothetical protein A1Q2_04474 [Trichosporon asahii var. asahii CBS 8904]|uniref:Uncharacterized protein n=1 Tax=Trichosporon asahii var. asahii (strain CBS 8904) TaxID=1220162 RepID=K1WIL2_TRIAC|nr:hypothetical protein A1Q2_04474 [Trichosporon asahii var. asahii CBS 8904]
MTLTDLSWTGFPRSVYRDRRKAWNPYPHYAGRRIEYAARLATAHWRELARAGNIRSVDKVTFKLTVLDKAWEM